MIEEFAILIGMTIVTIFAGAMVLSARRRRALDRYQREFTDFDARRSTSAAIPAPSTTAKDLLGRHRRLARFASTSIAVGIGAALLDIAAHFPPPGHRIMVQAAGAIVAVVGAVLLAVAYSDPAA